MTKIEKFGDLEILRGSANLSTLTDNRGGIFTWIPEDEIREFNLVLFNAGSTRGNHYHPEFIEYFMVIEGLVSVLTQEKNSQIIRNTLASSGFVFRAQKGVPHAIKALTSAKCMSLITKPWDECVTPIVFTPLIGFE